MKNYYDSINRIYNSYNSGKKISICRYSKFTMLLLCIFLEYNFINNYFLVIIKKNNYIIVFTKNIYFLKFISKPSRKISIKKKNISNLLLNISLSIVNTNLGLITLKECKKLGISGFIILIVL